MRSDIATCDVPQIMKSPAEPCLRFAKRSARRATPGWYDRTPTNDTKHARIQLDTPDANILIARSLHQRVTASL